MAESPDTSNYYNRQYAGIGNVSSYQVSGIPFVTGSGPGINAGMGQTVSFPRVTKSITLMPTSELCCLSFVPTGSSPTVVTYHSIFFPAAASPAITIDVKCNQVYISNLGGGPTAGGWTIYASLTGIDAQAMFPLTGSGLTD